MSKHIPTYTLNNLSDWQDVSPDVLLLSNPVNQVREPLIVPHRTNYYGIGVCIGGEAKLTVNLETYDIIPGCLIAMSPRIIKQWHYKSDDFQSFAILFTRDFLTAAGGTPPDRFPFFESVARHIFMLTPGQSANLRDSIRLIKRKLEDKHKYQGEILRSFISGLLYEVSSLYEDYSHFRASVQTRSQLLAADFKKLVNLHFLHERSVSFYANKLYITPGHLTETVREVTGKTPGEWITEAVVLEASVLLQNPALTVAQITDTLHFPNQSAFGKYFKNAKGLSPAAYRRS
nr:helix-turn-helix transcriptional regulator [Mucilaginibacter sp. L294]